MSEASIARSGGVMLSAYFKDPHALNIGWRPKLEFVKAQVRFL